MPLDLVFETHGRTEDNAAGIATGWLPGLLSAQGRADAAALGRRRREDGIALVMTSDLRRAVDTADLAFAGTGTPILHDWRLRECDYGSLNGAPVEAVHGARIGYLHKPHPGGESWTAATDRVGWFLDDLRRRWDGERVLVIGHLATGWGLERFVAGRELAELLAEDLDWREGWEYQVR